MIYLASSWRNKYYSEVLALLRNAGYFVYDFRAPGTAFSWSEIDPAWKTWTQYEYLSALGEPRVQAGFARDFAALREATTCVLLLPCGRSAHAEAFFMFGQQKDLIIHMPEPVEPELMYLLANHGNPSITTDPHTLLRRLLFSAWTEPPLPPIPGSGLKRGVP